MVGALLAKEISGICDAEWDSKLDIDFFAADRTPKNLLVKNVLA